MSTTNPTKITSEWDDIQVKFGNYAPLPVEETEEDKTLNLIERSEQLILQSEEALRAKRLEQLKKQHSYNKFGSPVDINSDNFVDAVTNYSKNAPVIVFLYDKTGRTYQVLKSGYEIVARKYPSVKFAIGDARNIISNYTGTSLSALLIYNGGTCVSQASAAQVIAMQGSHLADKTIEQRAADAIHGFIVNSGIELPSASESSDSESGSSDYDVAMAARKAIFGSKSRDSDDSYSDEEYERTKSKAYTSNLINRVLKG